MYDGISDPIDRLVERDAKKTRLQLYRRGDDWYCTFNAEYDADTSGETPIGVDIRYFPSSRMIATMIRGFGRNC